LIFAGARAKIKKRNDDLGIKKKNSNYSPFLSQSLPPAH
jgi:hypothetical protein